ncbi:hypothetical protein M409DRAFT_55278 [Zasmidium cellare ATCC 36951]|uniref:Uncharacterized protein n=1 Tax=Zasmidium cellare ATCC 36951 TaxID=1080233 RepID=A0A6A6CI93_ZASCE|nr:uncharacterized protein M409DRAFT_55278 [Zasmidium cellare ATCC 36951]KAF2165910.1 hypothetical protein M409DRAFT_55278 [Zasmidium cellare ATCC 36951]
MNEVRTNRLTLNTWVLTTLELERRLISILSYLPKTGGEFAAQRPGVEEGGPGRVTDNFDDDDARNDGLDEDVPQQQPGDSARAGGPGFVGDMIDHDADLVDESRCEPDETPAEMGDRLAMHWRRMKREGYEHLFDVFEKAAIISSTLGQDYNALLVRTKAGLSSGGKAPPTKSCAEATVKDLERRFQETALALGESTGRYSQLRKHEEHVRSNVARLEAEQPAASKHLEDTRIACQEQSERMENLQSASVNVGTTSPSNYLDLLPSLPPAVLAQIIQQASALLTTMGTGPQQPPISTQALQRDSGCEQIHEPTLEQIIPVDLRLQPPASKIIQDDAHETKQQLLGTIAVTEAPAVTSPRKSGALGGEETCNGFRQPLHVSAPSAPPVPLGMSFLQDYDGPLGQALQEYFAYLQQKPTPPESQATSSAHMHKSGPGGSRPGLVQSGTAGAPRLGSRIPGYLKPTSSSSIRTRETIAMATSRGSVHQLKQPGTLNMTRRPSAPIHARRRGQGPTPREVSGMGERQRFAEAEIDTLPPAPKGRTRRFIWGRGVDQLVPPPSNASFRPPAHNSKSQQPAQPSMAGTGTPGGAYEQFPGQAVDPF